jgi:hypothetical protein
MVREKKIMQKIVYAFDVDGTLRCNCTPTCQDINRQVVDGLIFLKHMKNSRIMIWSGGGAEYARNFFASKFPEMSKGICFASKLDPSTWKWGQPDWACDDIQECNLAKYNAIVREK